jgi:hypothetical protein
MPTSKVEPRHGATMTLCRITWRTGMLWRQLYGLGARATNEKLGVCPDRILQIVYAQPPLVGVGIYVGEHPGSAAGIDL